MKASTFLIKSTKNKSFGTAFCIDSNEEGSFLLTAAHVITSCDKEALEVEHKKAKLIAIGEEKGIDLAVIFVKDLMAEPLKLNKFLLHEGMEFLVEGVKAHLQNHKLENLTGKIKKKSRLKTQYKELDIYELTFNVNDNIERGYSGSAIVSQGYVFAVVVSRYNDSHADAIPITYLEDVWKEMPMELLESTSVEMISGTLEPQTVLGRNEAIKKPWLKYFAYLLLFILLGLFIREVPYIQEANKLSRFDTQMMTLYTRWEGIAKYKNNEHEKADIAQNAIVMAEVMEGLEEKYLDSLYKKSEKYERISYAYGIAAHMYVGSKQKILFAGKSIDAGKKALDLIETLGSNKKRKDQMNLIITLSYIIKVEEGEEALFEEAKQQYQGVETWYHSPNNITNQIDVIDRFIGRLKKEK